MFITSEDLENMADCWPKTFEAQLLLEHAEQNQPIELPVLRSKSGVVSEREYKVDFNDPAACTELRVLYLLSTKAPGFGLEANIPHLAKGAKQ